MSGLPADLQSDNSLAQFKGDDAAAVLPVLAKSYIETKALTGRKAYNLPADDWTPEQWSAWNKSIGVPEKADGYGTVDEAQLAKSGISKEVLTAAMEKFRAQGLTPRQVKGILQDWYIPEAIRGAEMETTSRAAAAQATIEGLKTEWGADFDSNTGLASAVIGKFGTPELKAELDKAGIGNNPHLFKMLVAIGKKVITEDPTRAGLGLGQASGKAAAKAEIDAMKADPAFMKRFTSGDPTAAKKWNDLHNLAYAD